MKNKYLNPIIPMIFAISVVCCIQAAQGQTVSTQQSKDFFSDKPYILNLEKISELDPKPLKIEKFSPHQDPRAQGIRIISTGRIFPFSYEIINIKDATNPDILSSISKSLDNHSDIILKEQKSNNKLGNYLHYFQRISLEGKPHHVSSNYIFIKNNIFYHLAANNYAAATSMPRNNWGVEKADGNAENEVKLLINSMEFK
ncbi:MAG: hypothetical protein V4525_14410 [Pseudomonadota bacterium]